MYYKRLWAVDLTLLYRTNVKTYLLSKHNHTSILQIPVKAALCNLNIIHISKDQFSRMFALWTLILYTRKLFNASFVNTIKIVKRKGRKIRKKSNPYVTNKPFVHVYNSVLTLKNFYKRRYVRKVLFLDKYRLSRDSYVVVDGKQVQKPFLKITNHVFDKSGLLYFSYNGIFKDCTVIDMLKRLDYGFMPTVKILFKYFMSTRDLINIKFNKRVETFSLMLKSIVTFLA